MKYYHITPIENKDKILKEGLKSNIEQEIFLFSKLSIAKHICLNQLMLFSYSLFEIKPKGIVGEIINDDVADIGADAQWIVKQAVIEPSYLKYIKDVNFNMFDEAEKQNLQMALVFVKMGEKIDPTKYVESIVSTDEEWVKYYNKKHGKNLKFNPLKNSKSL